MAKYLTAELPRLVKEVVKTEIPGDQRSAPATRTQRRRPAKPRTGTRTRASA